MSTRQDPHRPGAIVPTSYVCVLAYALPDPGIPGDRGYNGIALQQFVHDHELDFPESGLFGHPGKCGVCGARFGYGELWKHEPTNDLVHLGHDCAIKYELFSQNPTWVAELESLKRGRAAYMEGVRRAEDRRGFLALNPGLEEALKHDHHISADLNRKFQQYCTLSPKQVALALKLAAEPKRIREEEKHIEAPVTEGKRQRIQGKIVSKKAQENDYGVTMRLTIKMWTPEGSWLAWGSAPSLPADQGYCEVGDEIAFDAMLTRSDKDPHFAFYKRPTKAVKIGLTKEKPEEAVPAEQLGLVGT